MGLGIQIASLFASIGVDSKPLEKGLGGAQKSLQQFAGEMAKNIVGTVGLATAVYKAGQAVVEAVNDWADYADSMRLSAQMAGVTTEEMSRLVQAADDFRVPMETMQQAMEMALKNGFVPTIENLAELSDRLMGISDPALRAAEASQIFGKSYADIMPFLLAGGDAIRESTDSIDKNLVVTEEAAEEAKAYKDALDNLGDAWTGLESSLGKVIVPIATDIITKTTSDLQKFLRELEVLQTANRALGESKIGWSEFWAAVKMGEDWDSPTYMEDTKNWLIDTQRLIGGSEWDSFIKSQQELEQTIFNGSQTWEEYHGRVTEAGLAIGYFTEAGFNAAKSVSGVNNAVGAADLSAARGEYLATASVLREDLAGAYDAVKTAEDNWKSGVAGQIKVELDEKKNAGQLDTQGYIVALETLDSYAGTQFAYEFKIEESIPDLVKSLIEDPAGFLSDMATFENAMMPLDTAVSNAMALVSDLQQQLIDLERTYYATVQIAIGGGTGIGGGSSDSIPWYLRASGGPVSDGAPYIVGEQGPELFVPGASGQIVSNDMLGGGNSEMLGDILMELQSQPSRIKVAVREAMALVGG